MKLDNLQRDGRVRVVLAGLAFLGCSVYVLLRVIHINPVLLQDEWIYLVTSRHQPIWALENDINLGNYAFNLVYSATRLVEDYYLAAKVLNVIFFTGFAGVIFQISRKFLAFWLSALIAIATLLSPLSAYTSMFLPESMFFFIVALFVYSLIQAVERDNSKTWILTGFFIGLAAIVKPHALLTVIALIIFLPFLQSEDSWVKALTRRGLLLLVGFFGSRFGLATIIAGPQSWNLLSSYGAGDALLTLIEGNPEANGTPTFEVVGSGNVNGMLAILPTQLVSHFYFLLFALAGCILVLLVLFPTRAASRPRDTLSGYSLFVVIWVAVMVIAIAMFSGWITGGGDDHTLRVLSRYYEFVVPFVIVATLALLFDSDLSKLGIWRLLPVVLVVVSLSQISSGYFAGYSVQIADTPFLAGLVVNGWVGQFVLISWFLVAVVFFVAPRLLRRALPMVVSAVFIIVGYQTIGAYDSFRGSDSSSDSAGKLLKSRITDSPGFAKTVVVASSRFEARVASFHADLNNEALLLAPGQEIGAEQIPVGTDYLLVLGEYQLMLPIYQEEIFDGFALYRLGQVGASG